MTSINNIEKIIISKRHIKEMDVVDQLTFIINKNEVNVLNNNDDFIKKIKYEQIKSNVVELYTYLKDLENTKFQTQLYDKKLSHAQNKFFVCYQFKNKTYLAIKGSDPTNELHYKDIMSTINKLLDI